MLDFSDFFLESDHFFFMMTHREQIAFTRERSFSTPPDSDMSPPPFPCPPVVMPSGTHSCTASIPPQLSEIELKLLRGMTLSVSVRQRNSSMCSDECETPYQDCDCWLSHDKNDGFLFTIWNFTTGELREICVMLLDRIEMLKTSDEKGNSEILVLTCTIPGEMMPPPPADMIIEGDEKNCVSGTVLISFLVKKSSSPAAEDVSACDLFSVLQDAREVKLTAQDSTDDLIKKSCPNKSPRNRRQSVMSTSSKRVSIFQFGSQDNKDDVGKRKDSEGSMEQYPGVNALIEKFSKNSNANSNNKPTLVNTASVRNIFGAMDEVSDEDDEDDIQG